MQTLIASDISFLGTLPPDVRHEAEQWRDLLVTVTKPIGQSLARVAQAMGVSVKTARRKYDDWLKSGGNIRSLVNRAKVPDADSALTPEFLDWFKALAESNQRKTRPAWRAFARLWRDGAAVPGLDNSLPRHCLPAGTGYDNVQRRMKDAFSFTAMRHGLGMAIARHGPKIFTTRANLWYGSHYMIDDLWHDNFVVFGRQIVRVLELDALDVFSGCLVTFGCKPRFKRADGSFDNLKEETTRLIVADIFFREGYSERGTELLAEHGTAAVSEHCAKILFDRSGGKIVLRESGITGQEQAVIGWRGQGKGNPRFKAALESVRNLKHNELAMLPAQTGKDVESRPEYTRGLLVQASEELKALAVLAQKNPQRAAAFKLRLLDYHAHFLPLLIDVYDTINRRDWHDLEGWDAAGNVAIEYRTTPTAANWLTDGEFQLLPEISQQLLLAAAEADPRYIQRRKLSPAEVRAREVRNLVRIPPFVVCELLGDDYAREGMEVKGAYFNEIADMEIAPEPLLFESLIITPEGHEEQLPDGKYTGFVNPFCPDQLFVCDAHRRCLGVAPRAQRVDRADPEALRRAFARREHRLAELKRPLLKRHAQSVREEMRRLDHNTRVLDTDEPFTEEEQQRADLVRDRGAEAAEDILARARTASPGGEDWDEGAPNAADDLLSAIGAPETEP